MKKLHVVEAVIRKSLPRLMELSQGCKLEKDGYYYTYLGKFMVNVRPYTDGYYLHHFSSEDVINKKKVSFIYQLGDKKFKHYKILGHDVLTNDVLEWLGHERKNELYTYSLVDLSNNILKVRLVTQISDVEHHAYEEMWENIEIDLTKPRLADQSEELINVLYDLVNSEE